MRRGVHAGNHALVAHVVTGEDFPKESLVGFVVPKKVFKRANQRNLAKRRLRHLMRKQVHLLPPHTLVVIRLLPGAKDCDYSELKQKLDTALGKVIVKLKPPETVPQAANETH